MILTIAPTIIENWKYGSNVELRIRTNKQFVPKDLDVALTPSNFDTFICTTSVNVTSGETYLSVPLVQLYTTTDSDLGDNVRYIAEFWDNKKKQKITTFFVNNFKLDPSLAVGSNGQLVEPEWAAVAAFNRLYKRQNTAGLNIDLSDYPTTAKVLDMIREFLEGFIDPDGIYYTKEEIDQLLLSISSSVTEQINNFTLGFNYYTKPQVDNLLSNLLYNIFNGTDLTMTTYTKQQVNSMISGFMTADQVGANYYNKTQIDTSLSNLTTSFNNSISSIMTILSENSTVEKTISFVTDVLTLDQRYDKTLQLGKTYVLTEITVDTPARVRVYQTLNDANQDVGRAIGTKPTAGYGLVGEVNLPQNKLKQRMSPAPVGVNGDINKNSNVYIVVQKQTIEPSVVNVTIKYCVLEK